MRRRPRPHDGCVLRRSAHDPEAFSAFYDEHVAGVLRFLGRRTLDVEVARDLTAETFATAFRSRKRFRGTTDAEAAGWLFAIARHLHSRYVRNGVVERKATERLGIQLPTLDEDDYERIVQLSGIADERARVAAALGRLRPDQRAAIQLRIVDELSYEDVAARLSVTEPTARARVSRALRDLASALDRHACAEEA